MDDLAIDQERPWFRHYEQGIPTGYPAISPLFGDVERGPARSIWEQFERTVGAWGERTALVFEGTTISWEQLGRYVRDFSTSLAALGVGKGDKVVLQLPNIPQMVIAYFAVHRLGACVVMANPMYVAPEIRHMLVDSGADTMITLDGLWMNRVRAIRHATGLRNIIVAGIRDFLPFPKRQLYPLVGRKKGLWARVPPETGVHRFNDMLARRRDAITPSPGLPDDMACLQYTGGTTGISKGAVLTNSNLLSNAHQVAVWFPGLRSGSEIFVCALPFFHVFGLTCCLNVPTAIGATMLLVPDPRNLKSLISGIERHRPTMFPAVPAMFEGINRFPAIERRDLSSIKGCFSGSAPLSLDVMTRFESLTGARITEGFGLTEASPVTHVNPLFGLRKEGSIGVPMPGTDSMVVDLAQGTRQMPDHQPGELIIRGPQVMKGYWNHPDENAVTLRDGWLFTGDIAYRDEDGFFFIAGRKKEMIIAGGYNIYPREIDEVLYAHPDILEAASVGIPDRHRGETVWAFVVPRPEAALRGGEVVTWCRERLARYKVPRRIVITDALPRSAVGKILRRELREKAIAMLNSEGENV